MFNIFKKIILENHPLRLLYYKFLAVIAAFINGFPAEKMIVIGVAGTTGKTTTVSFISGILASSGHKVGQWMDQKKTGSFNPFFLQGLLKEMVSAGKKFAVLEVSSNASVQSKFFGINFDVGVVTSVDNYLPAQGDLFKKVSRGKRKFGVNKVLVMNADDKYYTYFNQFIADRKITYGLKSAVVYAENVEKSAEGSHFIMHVPNNAVPIKIGMPGEFNVYNALAAASVCMALQIPLENIKRGLEEMTSVSGRYEHIKCGQKYSVIMDYAHTPEGLDGLFSLYRKLTPGRLFTVFGASGMESDKSKRSKMGAVGNEYADYLIITDDDPYEEDEFAIIDDVCSGIPRKEGSGFWKIPDRREAIRLALTLAKEGDCVIVAGKGAEEITRIRGKTISWSDKKVITELLQRDVEVEISQDEWEKRENVCHMS
jgi:UDP-N-acetylmuramoyl-L-alanyl-D-glutamate--2,6-diaminopimelate ligase